MRGVAITTAAIGLRGSRKPLLADVMKWVGFRVDDVFGASVGRVEDIWVDPSSGEPSWILVREGRFGGGRHHTLIPFEGATAGAGHVWIPYEREVVRTAPMVHPLGGLPASLAVELNAHYGQGSELARAGAG